MIDRLANRLVRLPEYGIEAFYFRDVVGPLKRRARECWRAIWEQGEGEITFDADDGLPRFAPLIPPDAGYEERDAFSKLVDCVERRLDRHPDRGEREHLWRIWVMVRNSALAGRSRPRSWKKIAEALQCTTDRVKKLYGIPERCIRDCQRA